MKLSSERRAVLLSEMQLATQFNTKAWCRRFGISPRQVKRLRAEARELLAELALKGPVQCHVVVFNSGGSKRPAPKVEAA
jgi:hypothetical protein